jgi:hypothetical protein
MDFTAFRTAENLFGSEVDLVDLHGETRLKTKMPDRKSNTGLLSDTG